MKVILITGSSSGFGKEMTVDLLKAGHRVIASMRNAHEREHLFSNIPENLKANLTLLPLDVTLEEERKATSQFIKEKFDGKLDILVNNAGYGMYGALEDISEEQIRHQLEVNFFGATLLIRELLPYLRESKGKIINISSLMGRFSLPLGSVYSASKYAMEGITEGLYYELKPFGVQITTVEPGAHRTGFIKAVIWGEGSKNEKSPYYFLTNALEGFMQKMASRDKGTPSKGVSVLVQKLINSRKMPRRVLVGKDAVATGWMQKILPESIYHFFLSFGYSKMLKRVAHD